jgi:putative transcriptional regulator
LIERNYFPDVEIIYEVIKLQKYKCRLKVILAEEGIRQKEFSQKAGISESTLSGIVNGHTLPSFENTYLICKELNKPIWEIWVEEKENN